MRRYVALVVSVPIPLRTQRASGEHKKILVKGEHKPARNIIRVSEFPVSSRVMLPFSRCCTALRRHSLLFSRCRAALRASLRAHARFAPLFYHKRCCAALRASLRAHARYKIKNRLRNSQASLQFLSLFSILHRLV